MPRIRPLPALRRTTITLGSSVMVARARLGLPPGDGGQTQTIMVGTHSLPLCARLRVRRDSAICARCTNFSSRGDIAGDPPP